MYRSTFSVTFFTPKTTLDILGARITSSPRNPNWIFPDINNIVLTFWTSRPLNPSMNNAAVIIKEQVEICFYEELLLAHGQDRVNSARNSSQLLFGANFKPGMIQVIGHILIPRSAAKSCVEFCSSAYGKNESVFGCNFNVIASKNSNGVISYNVVFKCTLRTLDSFMQRSIAV